jgi:hypothetical protein
VLPLQLDGAVKYISFLLSASPLTKWCFKVYRHSKGVWGGVGSCSRGGTPATKRMRVESQEGKTAEKPSTEKEESVQKGPDALQPIDPLKQHR